MSSYTARYGIDSCRYHERSSELERVIGKQYRDLSAIQDALEVAPTTWLPGY
jgi:hypothetical protein